MNPFEYSAWSTAYTALDDHGDQVARYLRRQSNQCQRRLDDEGLTFWLEVSARVGQLQTERAQYRERIVSLYGDRRGTSPSLARE